MLTLVMPRRWRGGQRPCHPTRAGYATGYLWEETWARDSVLDLIRQFIHEVEEEDDNGRKTGKRFLIFPRYHQLDAVRRLVADARANGAGQRYLIQHSAGSGKSNTIAWLAHQLSTLHDAADRRVFDSIVVITDRRVLDRQLQTHHAAVRADARRGGEHRHDVAPAQGGAGGGKTIIVTTLQKFPVIVGGDRRAAGQALRGDRGRGALLAVAARAPRASRRCWRPAAWRRPRREESEAETPRRSWKTRSWRRCEKRGRLPNLSDLRLHRHAEAEDAGALRHASAPTASSSRFTSTACARRSRRGSSSTCWRTTPPTRLLEPAQEDRGRPALRQAEGRLPAQVVRRAAPARHRREGADHGRALRRAGRQGEIGGRAKAMIVTRSRLHAVRYKQAVDKYLEERGYPFKALVAFSGHGRGRRAGRTPRPG